MFLVLTDIEEETPSSRKEDTSRDYLKDKISKYDHTLHYKDPGLTKQEHLFSTGPSKNKSAYIAQDPRSTMEEG